MRTKQILELINIEPLTDREIAAKLHADISSVRSDLAGMLRRGSVRKTEWTVPNNSKRGRRESVCWVATERKVVEPVPQPIKPVKDIEFKPLSRDPFAHMKRCMATR